MRLDDQPHLCVSSSRREFLGAAALALTGIGGSRLSAAQIPTAPVKRPPNPYVYKFNIGGIEAFSISDGHMLFKKLSLIHI